MLNKLKKFTPYNLFVKWPKIIRWRLKEKIFRSPFRILLFYKQPIILEDDYGVRFVLYPWNRRPLKKIITRNYCENEFRALKKIIRAGDLIFDVGANIGLHTTLFSRWNGPQGQVFSFEPVSDTYWQLQQTIALNRLTNVKAYQLALADKKGQRIINLFEPANSEWNSFGTPEFNGLRPISQELVETDTLDNFCREHQIKQIDFLKIDVEGFEKEVLLGAEQMLKNRRILTLSFEISRVPLQGAKHTGDEVFQLLKRYGYSAYRFNKDKQKFIGPFSTADDQHENYYASQNDLTKL